MTNNLPFLKDPERFLQSYFWGCNQGHHLSVKCRQLLARMAEDQRGVQATTSTAVLSEAVMESVLDCYVHSKACARCEPMEKITCQQGYALIKQRDNALDEAFRMGVHDRALSGGSDSLTHDQLEAIFHKEFAQQQFALHMSQCPECSLKRPRGRYNLAAWNIEAVRSQRM